jgi:hypothetical protein
VVWGYRKTKEGHYELYVKDSEAVNLSKASAGYKDLAGSTSGFAYDAAGNMTQDPTATPAHVYQWDAEGRLVSVDAGSPSGWTAT